MSASEIQVESAAGRTRLRLPMRDLGGLRQFGWLAIGGGVFTGLFMLFWISGPLLSGIDLLQQGQWFGWLLVGFASTGLIGLSAAVTMLTFGIALLRQNTYGLMEIRSDRLLAWERFGLLWKRVTNVPLDQIRALEIAPVPRELLGQLPLFGASSALETWCSLRAAGDGPSLPGTWLASAYPRELLVQAAERLKAEAARTSTRGIRGTWMETPVCFTLPIADGGSSQSRGAAQFSDAGQFSGDGDGEVQADGLTGAMLGLQAAAEVSSVRPQRPESCRVEVVRQPGQPTVFRLPALGFRGQAAGMLVFAFVWNGFIGLMAFFMLASAIGKGDFWEPLPMLLFMIPFVGVGVFLLVYGLNLARRTALIGVDPDFLFCETQGLRKKSWVEIPLVEVQSIEVGASGTELNDQPLMQLQIKHTTPAGQITRLFTGVPEAELEWIASEIWDEVRQVRGDRPSVSA